MLSLKICYQTVIKYAILISFSIKTLIQKDPTIFDILALAVVSSLVIAHGIIKLKQEHIRKETLNKQILDELHKDKEKTEAAIANLAASVTSLRLPDAMRALNNQINKR